MRSGFGSPSCPLSAQQQPERSGDRARRGAGGLLPFPGGLLQPCQSPSIFPCGIEETVMRGASCQALSSRQHGRGAASIDYRVQACKQVMQRGCKPGWLEPVRNWCQAGVRIDVVPAHKHAGLQSSDCISQHCWAAPLTPCSKTMHQSCGCVSHTASSFFHTLLDLVVLSGMPCKLQLSFPNQSRSVLLYCFHSTRNAKASLNAQLHSVSKATRLHITGYTCQKLTNMSCGMCMRESTESEQAGCKHDRGEGGKQKGKQGKQHRGREQNGKV